MRIFYAVGETPSAGLVGSRIWRSNLHDSLVDLGHEVVEFDFDLDACYANADPASPDKRAYMDRVRPRLELELESQTAAAHAEKPLDVVFCYFYNTFCSSEVILRIGEAGVTTINWYCNASYQFHLVSEIAAAFDWCLVPERYRLEDYRRVGARPLYCQEAANPAVYHPVEVSRDQDVVFVGGAYGNRPEYVRALADAGVHVRAYGMGWEELARPLSVAEAARRSAGQVRRRLEGRRQSPPRLSAEVVGAPLGDAAMVEMFSRAKITLGFSVVGEPAPGEEIIRQVRLRDFEVPMSGGFYMLEYVDEIKDFFVPDKEIVCFSSRQEMVEKAHHYLMHDDEREAIRAAGYARARKDHTWQKRLTHAFSQAGLGRNTG
jgi:spore maturation protein CgeB